MSFLLDSNVLITAKNTYYAFEFCPAFWDWLSERHRAGVVLSIEKVRDELTVGNDDLADWAMRRGDSFFRPSTPADRPALNAVADWVEGQNYEDAAILRFMDSADHYLIGQAHAGRHTVVTLEDTSFSRKNVKIPNVCGGMGVHCMDTFDMLRIEQARFVLGGAR